MNIRGLIEVLTPEFSTGVLLKLVSQLSQFHRVQGSSGYFQAAEYIQSILEANNIDCELYEHPADGKWEMWDYTAPISWDISSGEMWLVKPYKKRLCSFRDSPMSVITHSKPVDFEAPVVDVGAGDRAEDYAAAAGKIALLTAGPRGIFPLAAKHGVRGLILYPNPRRAMNIGASSIQYDGFWPSSDTLNDVTAGFSLSLKQAQELKELLQTEKEVRVHFKIDARFYEGGLHVLEAELPGSEHPLEEVILMGHLCHPAPSANDNASGSATLVELVLVLKRLIAAGKLVPPKRTLKFLWVPEFSGSIPWGKTYDMHRDKRKVHAVLNLDMVGESPAKIGTPLSIVLPSLCTPSYLPALIKNAATTVANSIIEIDQTGRHYQLNVRFAPFSGGSDHLIFNDQYFSIPSAMLNHADPYHHSSGDSIDKVDPLECRSAAVIAGAVGYGIATPTKDFINDLALFVVNEAIADGQNIAVSQNDQSAGHKVKLLHLYEGLAMNQLKSILELDSDGYLEPRQASFKQMIANHFSGIRKLFAVEISQDQPNERLSKVLKRNYEGITSRKLFKKPDRDPKDQKRLERLLMDHGGLLLELLNLANGIYTVEEIYLLLNSQYPEVILDDVIFLTQLFRKEDILTII